MNKSYNDLKNFWKNKKVFLTGHTGFKGTWLTIMLNMLEAKVAGYSLRPKKLSLFNQTKCSKLLKNNYFLDVNNLNTLKKKIKKTKPDIIFHLAAQPLVTLSFKKPVDTFQTNVIGTLNLLEAAKNVKSVKSVVIITTDKVYKVNTTSKSYVETDELGGKDPYSASKACSEILTNSYVLSFLNHSNLMTVSTARSGNVIGGGDYSKDRLVPDILESFNKNKILAVRNPDHVRPWQHVIEPLYGYLLLAEKQFLNQLSNLDHSWNFGPKKKSFISVKQVINKFRKKKLIKKILIKKNKNIETKILTLNSNKASKYLNWNQKWDIDQTLQKIIEWNNIVNKKKNYREICENQIKEYLKNKL
tara:strand:- start:166 stop:1242 length:1077 start_codon:yes stop_codon:yes gene_type:complete